MTNWERHGFVHEKQKLHNSLNSAIDSFQWGITPQGGNYWAEISSRAERGEFDQPDPNLHGWIPVTDRLPTADDADENGEVLVLDKNGLKSIGSPKWVKTMRSFIKSWQQLPKLQEVKGGGDD